MKKTIHGTLSILMLTGMLAAAFNVQQVNCPTPPEIQWSRTYGCNGEDSAFSLVQTCDGGYALAGRTNSFGSGGYDFWLVKTNSTGNIQWNKTYGEEGEEYATSIIQTRDGGYAIVGLTESFDAVGLDFWLVKIAPDREPTKWAVVIGVDEYSYAGARNADGGPGNSARNMYDILVESMSFPPDHIHLLVDEVGVADDDVTRTIIESELEWLQQVSILEDTVVFYYAGHGGQSQPDEYIIMHDTIMWDYEFAHEIDEIKSRNLCIILDTSISGGFITDR